MTYPYSPKSGTADVATLQKQIDSLNERVKLLESALKVTASEVLLTVPNGSLKIDVGTGVELKAGTTLTLESRADSQLKSGSILRLQGPQIHLN